MIAHETALLAAREEFEGLVAYVSRAAEEGEAIDGVERRLWERLLRMGWAFLRGYVALQGDGDVGETWELPTGEVTKRLEAVHERRYVSVFGELQLARRVYGSRKKQRFEAVPLEARLALPESDFSYLLEDWAQGFCVHNSFAESRSLLVKILCLDPSVTGLEQRNQSLAQDVASFQASQPAPAAETEGELLAVMADGKGIPMRRPADEPRPADPRHLKKGEKKNKKRSNPVGSMAYVGVSYTVARFPRTVDDVVNGLFGDASERPKRPVPQNKRLRAELGDEPAAGREALFRWLGEELAKRSPGVKGPVLFLADGEQRLEELARQEFADCVDFISVLDVMHVLPKLWDAAHCFQGEGTDEARDFVRLRLVRLLSGNVDSVVRGLRQRSTKHHLRGSRQKTLASVTQYFDNNRHRMKYDEYLAAGYPLGTGPVEGACRNLVKDRFERSGMRWSIPGAQAMLALRATYLNGDWEPFCAFRREQQTQRLYPYREALQAAWN